MELEVILFCCIFGLFILASYTLGLRNGQKLAKREEITMPEINPVTVINKQIERKEQQKEQEILDIMMSNIDNYDGTGLGQQQIPF
mgnify:CR=1 FL=1